MRAGTCGQIALWWFQFASGFGPQVITQLRGGAQMSEQKTTGVSPLSGPATDVASIGRAMAIKGRIESQQDLHVDGKLEGTVELNGNRLTVGAQGTVNANVKAREVIIEGS